MSGVIYKIVTGDDVYVGSTTNYGKRKNEHKKKINNEKTKNYTMKVYETIRANDGEYEINIYEENLSMTKDELREREEEVRLLLGATLNSRRAHQTKEQRKETERIRAAKWRDENKDIYTERLRSKIKCECGLMICYSSLARHKRTAKHIRLMTTHELA